MLKKQKALPIVVFLIICILDVAIGCASIFAWNNGGFSSDPSNPDYATHDWIAHHALDWLPLQEKQFIIDNLALYLYGTELSDNGAAPDGIGDTVKHHVYYYANGSLQNNASAVRAQEEYAKAVNFYKLGDLANASKKLGIVTHYISDLAVFAHVMGSKTDWGTATHHGDYEDYVEGRTNSYEDEFNVFLVFDGVLSEVSAYDAALALAYDTTFDVDGELTCLWMDQNYDWGNTTFKNRCGESLNLAVNLIADVLHTFFLEMQGVAHFIAVPFHYQNTAYYCGPACLEMVFDYYGEDISQYEIADVARTIGSPVYLTFTDEMRRAAHFSNLSTSMGGEMYENITGYTLRKLGYAAFEAFEMSLDHVKSYIDQDKPLILLMQYSEASPYGHYRVLTGYNETHVFLHDPWPGLDEYSGPNIILNYSLFLNLWSYSMNWTLLVSPWIITVSAPAYIKFETPFQVNATIIYPQPLPNSIYDYPASACNATITLPANLTLAQGEVLEKTIGTSFLDAGANSTVSWMLTANAFGAYTISIEAEGLISGVVDAKENYTAYEYIDRIGAKANFTIKLCEDNADPLIETVTRAPEDIILPYQEVTVYAKILDAESGVKNVTLYYNLNNSVTWVAKPMRYNLTSHLYNATIPGQPEETHVKFRIVAYDYVGNNATHEGTEICEYHVIPEFPNPLNLQLFLILAVSTILYVARKVFKTKSKPNRIE